ncbi:GNAT family N-acetyltransferase [Rudanella paleaurantiibacter]|uniref:GNAT family N-acetyltransferase n=1 Tax=Rudanella paleaurantiibacter TaxID=2614655 RepID=A0A7J5U2H2_9BACT|nr:GNAT family N-acetyltransferase [Rudanella paleaurantiibacter]KAB7731984.1 GNAT family N-acetyltransferase [Rudanella paleaurantiibacter]
MTHIRAATPSDFPTIEHIARQTWPVTFGEILSADQIEYMLGWMYSQASLTEQVNQKGHVFLIAETDTDEPVGYVSYELDYGHADAFGETATPALSPKVTKIHKLYLLPQTQGQGLGRLLIEEVGRRAQAAGNTALVLNVNRQNRAVQFYERLGFGIAKTEDIDIGNGFLMQDYVMLKPLNA